MATKTKTLTNAEVDAALAVKVMGWTQHSQWEGFWYSPDESLLASDRMIYKSDFRPTESYDSAFLVVAKMESLGWEYIFEGYVTEGIRLATFHRHDPWAFGREKGATLSEAISRAALAGIEKNPTP